MKKTVSLILVLVMLLSLCITAAPTTLAAETGGVLYVAPDGGSSGDGSESAPFGSLQQARDAVRERIAAGTVPAGGITVYLRGGTYPVSETTEFTAADSGTADKPIIYSAYPGETVIFNGGVTLNNAEFKNVTDSAILERLPEEAQAEVKQYDLSSLPINYDYAPYNEGYYPIPLIVNDDYAQIARWPNDDKDNPQFTSLVDAQTFVADYEVKDSWKTAKDAYLAGWLQVGYFYHYAKIAEFNTDDSTIKVENYSLNADPQYTGYHCIVNLLEEIDQPNEYYIDKETKTLYYYPTSDFSSSVFQIPLLEDVVLRLNGCSNVVFQGITFESVLGSGAGGFTLGGGFGGAIDVLAGSENNLIDSCTFRTIRGRVLYLDGKNNGVTSSKFYNCGGMGVGLNGIDHENATDAGNFVINCDFTQLNEFEKGYNPAVSLNGIGNIVAYNNMHDLFQQAILVYSATNCIVEYNEISNCMTQGHDMGAIYSQGRDDNTSLINGYNTFRYNYFHDNAVAQENGPFLSRFTYNLYFDHPSVAQFVYGNIIQNSQTMGAVYNNGGVYNQYDNNVFIDVNNAFYTRYSMWSQDSTFLPEKTQEEIDAIVNKDVNVNNPWKSKQINIFSQPWEERFPLLAQAWRGGVDPTLENSYSNNLLYNCTTVVDEEQPYTDNNLLTENDPFVDLGGGDLTIKTDSEVFTEIPDFQAIDFQKIGNFTEALNDKLSTAVALAIGTPKALVNGSRTMVDPENSNVIPQIVDSRTLVPVRFIAESFGAEVGWDPDTATVTVNLDGKTIQMVIGSNKISVDGVESELDVPAQSIEGRTMIPLRAMVEAVGKQVFWDERGLIVISDDANLFDPETDSALITRTLQQVRY